MMMPARLGWPRFLSRGCRVRGLLKGLLGKGCLANVACPKYECQGLYEAFDRTDHKESYL